MKHTMILAASLLAVAACGKKKEEPKKADPVAPAPTKAADPAPTKPADPAPTQPADPAPTQPADPAPTAGGPGAALSLDKPYWGLEIPKDGVVAGFTLEEYDPSQGPIAWEHKGGAGAHMELFEKRYDTVAAWLAGDSTLGAPDAKLTGAETKADRGSYGVLDLGSAGDKPYFVYVMPTDRGTIVCQATTTAAPTADLVKLCESWKLP